MDMRDQEFLEKKIQTILIEPLKAFFLPSNLAAIKAIPGCLIASANP